MTETNTDAIDEKKKNIQNISSDFSSNIIKFLTTVLSLIVLVIIYFSLSGLVLYGCKLGQSNISPTNMNCYPYTSETLTFPNNNEGIPINIFTTFTDPPLSMKINFPYNKQNSSNTLLDLLRSYKEEPSSHFLMNYFITILDSLFCFNYSSFNYILNGLNKLPETLIILFGPVVFLFAAIFIFLVDHIYFIYLWFASMGWFFKKNMQKDLSPGQKPSWKYVGLIETFEYLAAFFFVFLFIMLFGFVLLGLPFLPFVTVSLTILSLFGYSGIMNGKTVTSLSIIKELFKNYKLTIMTIFSIFVITSAFTNLGTVPGIFSIITLILIYFGIISIDLFKENKNENLTALTSYDQANKICNFKMNKETHGNLYKWLIGQKAGGIAKELKKIGKHLQEI
jgi:hypothetical protein